VNARRPNISQADRDVIEDLLADIDGETGSGGQAQHQDVSVAS
jgi:hypothetical protein